MDSVSNFALNLGQVIAGTRNEAVLTFLKEKGVTETELKRVNEVLLSLADAFYI